MNRLFLPGVLAATFATVAIADDKPKTIRVTVVKSDKGDKSGKRTEKGSARVIIVTADGQKREILIGDGKGLDKLPKGIRLRVEQALKGTAHKGGKGDKGHNHKGGKTAITRKVVGRVVIVGPDGSKKEITIGDGKFDGKALEGLPKDIRVKIERALKGPVKPVKPVQKRSGRVIVIGPDGKKQEFKFDAGAFDHKAIKLNLPKDVLLKLNELHQQKGLDKREIRVLKRGIFVGPDGKKHEFQLDGAKIDVDVILKGLPADVRNEVRKAVTLRWKGAGKGSVKPSADKLDLILKKLDSLQKQVDELRKRIDKK